MIKRQELAKVHLSTSADSHYQNLQEGGGGEEQAGKHPHIQAGNERHFIKVARTPVIWATRVKEQRNPTSTRPFTSSNQNCNT